MSATTASPVWKRPGATASPALRPWNVTVSVARTASPATSPVEASTPEGTSTETTGAAAALIRSIVAAASSRGSPLEAGAEERVDDHVGLLDSGRLDCVETLVAQNSRRDPAVASVRTAAADDGDPVRVGEELQHLASDCGAGPLHQLRRGLRVAGIPLLGRSHLGGRVEGLKHR